jgi:U3 small nucleolar RNA-associated protein 12
LDAEEDAEIDLVDLFTPHLVVRGSGKIRSFDFRNEDVKGGTPVRKFSFTTFLIV